MVSPLQLILCLTLPRPRPPTPPPTHWKASSSFIAGETRLFWRQDQTTGRPGDGWLRPPVDPNRGGHKLGPRPDRHLLSHGGVCGRGGGQLKPRPTVQRRTKDKLWEGSKLKSHQEEMLIGQEVGAQKRISRYQLASGGFASWAESIFFSILQVIDLPSIPKYNPFHWSQ